MNVIELGMSEPYISVVMPLYNKEAIVERSVKSVLGQSFKDLELVIVDDGSTDRSAEVVCAIDDDRIVFLQQENGGPSKARNTGVMRSKAPWIVFLDADDELTQGALEHFAGLSREYPDVDFFCCNPCWRRGDGQQITRILPDSIVKNIYKAHFLRMISPRCGTTMKSSRIAKENLFDERIRRYEDAEALFRIYGSCKMMQSSFVSVIVNADFAAASKGRKDIKEDFLGYLDINGKGFWHTLVLYQLFLQEKEYYPEQARELYPNLFHRYDLYLLCVLIGRMRSNKFMSKLLIAAVGNPVKRIVRR